MNKSTIFLPFFLLFFLSFLLEAQDFKVLSSQGNNIIKSSNKKIWTGSSLKKTDIVAVGVNGYLGLMHIKTGKTVEITKKGTYSLSKYAIGAGSTSVTAKYGNYVAEEVFKSEKQDINKNHRKYMAITGAVSRERKISIDENELAKPLTFIAKQSQEVYDTKVYLSWLEEANQKAQKYYIKIQNYDNEAVAFFETDEPFFEFDFNLLKKNKVGEPSFIITVMLADKPNSKATINLSFVEKAVNEEIAKDLGNTQPENALDYLIRAKYFEDKKLYLDAIKAYQKAIALQNLDSYKNAYMEFLAKNQIAYQYNPNFKE